MSDLVLYTSEDGRTRIDLRVEGQTVWLTQLEIAKLFQTTKQNVSLHARNIFDDGELSPKATVKESLTVQTEGKREVQRTIQLYNLDLILAIGYRVRKQDILIARNYLTEDEVDTLNRLVVIFLEQAELRAKQQKDLTLVFWRSSVDRMLASNDQPLLDGLGSVSHEGMKTIAADRYEDFDSKRRQQEAIEANAEDLKAKEELEKDLKRKGGKA